MLTKEKAERLVCYCPETGKFIWRSATPDLFEDGKRTKEMRCRIFNGRYAGREAFTAINGDGYKSAVICGVRTGAHRLAWLLSYGEWPDHIDHINGDKLDNRLSNLRNVSKAENSRNYPLSKRNKSGLIGVRYNARRSRWESDIRYNGRLYFLGRFKCLGLAIRARRDAEAKFGFHQNHGKR